MTDHQIHGIHAVTALLSNPLRSIKRLYLNQDRSDDKIKIITTLATERQIPIERLSAQAMNQRFSDKTHQGIVADASPLGQYTERDLDDFLTTSTPPLLILILDGVTDPHNLGACLRTADSAGVHCVIIPKDKSATITPAVSKVACGAAETVPLIRVTNLARTMALLKEAGVWIYGAAGEAKQSLYQMDCTSSIAVVLGAEGHGLRRLTAENCDHLFSIPMMGSVESLNVSVATGISLYEIVRQRL